MVLGPSGQRLIETASHFGIFGTAAFAFPCGAPTIRSGDIVKIMAAAVMHAAVTSSAPTGPRRWFLSSNALTRAARSDRLAIASAGDFRRIDRFRASATNWS